jgi:hypothetical protein
MSRSGSVLTTNGRAGEATSTPVLRRARPPRAVADVAPHEAASGWGPHPDAQAHRLAPAPSPVAVIPPPVAGAVGMLAPAPVPRPAVRPAAPRRAGAAVATAPPAAAPPAPAADPALLPTLAPRPDRPLTFVQRVTLMLQRLSRPQGRHRTGHSVHHWSMFAPHPGARRRTGSRARR